MHLFWKYRKILNKYRLYPVLSSYENTFLQIYGKNY